MYVGCALFIYIIGAISTFTISLAQQVAQRGIRVNSVAPGPIWTPLQPSTGWPKEKLEKLGQNTWMGRAGQPEEVAPAYVFLAAEDGRYTNDIVAQSEGGLLTDRQIHYRRNDRCERWYGCRTLN